MKRMLAALLSILFVLCAASCNKLPGLGTAAIRTRFNDPYSYVAKAYYALTLAQNYEYFSNAMRDVAQFKKDFAKGFQMLPDLDLFLFTDNYHEIVWRDLDYALHDIDGNGTKEFLLGHDNFGNEHDILEIYTVRNGIAVQLQSLGDYLSTLYNNGTLVIVADEGHKYHRFEDGTLASQIFLNGDVVSDEYYYHNRVDGVGGHISKEEYDRLGNELRGDGQEAALEWKPLAEYGR